jgi:DNA ligase D-like protein (predicted polymerase)
MYCGLAAPLIAFADWAVKLHRRPFVQGDAPVVAGIRISHPDRVIYPDLDISKLQLARYFERIGGWILPHVRGRPLTLVHCPAGLGGPCRFLRHAKVWGPDALRRVRIREKTKIGEYLVADTVSAVVALAQMGIVEIHTWNSTVDDVERPNRLVWDLDPGPEVTWRQTVAAARLLRGVLDTLGLASWVKTTGGRGLHVVVPITPDRVAAGARARVSVNPDRVRAPVSAVERWWTPHALAGRYCPEGTPLPVRPIDSPLTTSSTRRFC